MKSLRRSGVEVVNFVPPFRSILRGRANLRNHRKMLVADAERASGAAAATSPPSTSRAIRDSPAALAAWHDLSFDLRGELVVRAGEQFEKDWAYATRHAASRDARARRRRSSPPLDASLAQLVPSGPEQVDDTVQALLVSGCFMARAAHPRGHALLHSRRDAADGADAGGAARRAGRHRPAAPLEPPPRRRRPPPAAARPRRPPARGSGSRRSCCTPRSSSSTSSSRSPARPTSTCAASSSTTS